MLLKALPDVRTRPGQKQKNQPIRQRGRKITVMIGKSNIVFSPA